jgi:ABC-type transport system involved in multi-copper enzyme maturation permease subunit
VNDAPRLLGSECRRVLRSPAVWAVLALLLVAGACGALNTERLHDKQAADLAIRQRAARSAQPSSEDLPYWQDPTGASGFSRYFLKRFAAKHHLPLSVLSVGQSDLQPFAVPIRLETLFGGDRVYDFESPRALATGPFDLGFVLVFLLPLCLGAIAATIGAQERDQGILAMIAAQPVSPRRWWSVRLAALTMVLVPAITLCVGIALAVASAPVFTAWPETVAAAALVAMQILFWLAVAGSCLARGQGAVATVFSVAGVWLVLTVGAPLAGSLAVQSMGARHSAVVDVNELRRITDEVQHEADGVVARRLVARLGEPVRSIDPTALDYSTRLELITEENGGTTRGAGATAAAAGASCGTDRGHLVVAFTAARVPDRTGRSRRHRKFSSRNISSRGARFSTRSSGVHVPACAGAGAIADAAFLSRLPWPLELHRVRCDPAVQPAGRASIQARRIGAPDRGLARLPGSCYCRRRCWPRRAVVALRLTGGARAIGS